MRTCDGFAKPDLVAPGKNIVSLTGNLGMGLSGEHPENIVDGSYFMMSGTSVAAPIVSGAAALLLEDEPDLTPDQVKYRLMSTANRNWRGYSPEKQVLVTWTYMRPSTVTQLRVPIKISSPMSY